MMRFTGQYMIAFVTCFVTAVIVCVAFHGLESDSGVLRNLLRLTKGSPENRTGVKRRDCVEADEPIAQIESDKVTIDVCSPVTGIIEKVEYQIERKQKSVFVDNNYLKVDSKIPLLALEYEPPRTNSFKTVEASLRIDAVASAGFKNGTTVKTGDVVSVSGKGRLKIGEINENLQLKSSDICRKKLLEVIDDLSFFFS